MNAARIRSAALLAVAAAAFGAAAVLFVRGDDLPDRPESILALDARTGEIIRVPLGNGRIVPIAHPDTGDLTLFPITEATLPEGLTAEDLEQLPPDARELIRQPGLYVELRYLRAAGVDPADLAEHIDPETGRVLGGS